MKRLLFLTAVAIPMMANAAMEKSPIDMYSMSNLLTTETQVKIVIVKDINKTCSEVYKALDKVLTFKVEACSTRMYYDTPNKLCTIYISESTNNDILGHELHHCFAGSFH